MRTLFLINTKPFPVTFDPFLVTVHFSQKIRADYYVHFEATISNDSRLDGDLTKNPMTVNWRGCDVFMSESMPGQEGSYHVRVKLWNEAEALPGLTAAV